MKFDRTFSFLAGLTLLGTFWTWLTTGAHFGWTQNQIRVTDLDEITGIEAVRFVPGFVAGVDFLAVALGLTATLLALAWWLGRRRAARLSPAA